MNPIIIIPSRLDAVRLPRKPLLKIKEKTMVEWVYEQALASQVGHVAVACCGEEIAETIRNINGQAVITDPTLSKGTDRVHAALQEIDPEGRYDVVINVQGDMPFVSPSIIREALRPIEQGYDIGTVAAPMTNPDSIHSQSMVKIAMTPSAQDPTLFKAIYFSRAPLASGLNQYYEHIGVYAYKREALNNYVSKPVSFLEKTEMLEQLRALEAGMSIGVAVVEQAPISVDTPQDFEKLLLTIR